MKIRTLMDHGIWCFFLTKSHEYLVKSIFSSFRKKSRIEIQHTFRLSEMYELVLKFV